MNYPSIRIEGAILSPDILGQIEGDARVLATIAAGDEIVVERDVQA